MTLNQDEWHEGLVKWLKENAVPQGTPEENTGWNCKDCGEELQGREKTASLHLRGTLAGGGEVVTLTEPFCPKCGKGYGVPLFLDYGGLRDIF